MLKKIARIFVVGLVVFFTNSVYTKTSAQTTTPKFEVGGDYSLLNFDTLASFSKHHRRESGVGARFTYNVNKYFAAETAFDFFPQHDSDRVGTFDIPLWGSKFLGVFGAKAGIRRKRFGIFGKARPGFIHFSNVPSFVCVSGPCPQPPTTNFAFNYGAVFEYYPSKRTELRIDGGDTFIHHDPRFLPSTHQFQTSIGFGVRFK